MSTAPILTKEFTDDPVGAGDTVTMNFTIENTSDSASLSDIAFTDNLSFGPGLTPTSLPASGFCGPGSSIITFEDNDQLILSVFDASLDPSASCSFDVTLLVPQGAVGGKSTNTTSEITALLGGEEPVVGSPASADISIVAAPSLDEGVSRRSCLARRDGEPGIHHQLWIGGDCRRCRRHRLYGQPGRGAVRTDRGGPAR